MSDFVRVMALADLPEGTNRAVDVDGTSILVARTAMGVFAVANVCSHAQQALEGGKMKAVHLFCPLHGVRFDMRTGCPSGTLTTKAIRTWPTRVDDGHIFVEVGD